MFLDKEFQTLKFLTSWVNEAEFLNRHPNKCCWTKVDMSVH